MSLPSLKSNTVIASAAWQSNSLKTQSNSGLLRRFAPCNEGQLSLRATQSHGNPVLNFIIILFLSTAPCLATVKFDGVNDHIKIESLSISAPLTFSFWVNLKSYSSGFPSFISSASGNLTIGTTATQSFYAAGLYFTASPIPLNVWVHRTYIISGGNISLYNNSSFVESRPFGITNFNGFTVGCYHPLTYFADSEIDDVRIYNRPLTTPEIESLYQSRSKRPSGSLANGLVAHYEMDDGAIGEIAAQAKDSTINLNHGQFTGFNNLTTALSNDAPSQISTGHSLEFDGVNDHVRIGDNPTLESSSRMTLSTWIKSSSAWPSSEGIIEKRINGTEYYQYGLAISSNNLYFLQSTSGTAWDTFVFTSTLPTAQSWHHLVGTNDGSVARLYIDGLEVGTPDASPTATLAPSTSSLNLGLGRIAGLDNYLNGKIDDTRIYNRALTPSEISFLYNGSGSNPGTSNLQALWTFDDDSALKDSSGNNNHGAGVGGDSLKYTGGILRR